MAVREIDDSAPEFARPYEPVGKGKHHKSLNWGMASGFVLILAAALLAPAVAELIPVVEPTPEPIVVAPEPEPEPEPEPAYVSEPTVTFAEEICKLM